MTETESLGIVYRGISAPNVNVLYTNSLIMRAYSGLIRAHTESEYAYFFPPDNHKQSYGMAWVRPGMAANRYAPQIGPSGEALSWLSGVRVGKLAAHTMVLKPLFPEVEPDDDLLDPPDRRRPPIVWVTDPGAPPNAYPPDSPYWRPIHDVPHGPIPWQPGITYGPGVPIWHEGRTWLSPPPVGVPGETGSTWVPINPQPWVGEGSAYKGGEFVWKDGKLYMAMYDTDSEPGVGPAWREITPVAWQPGMTYAPGVVVVKDGQLYTTPYPPTAPGGGSAEPSLGGGYILPPRWREDTAYPPGSVVTLPPPGGSGTREDDDGYEMGYPPGGDIAPLFYRGITSDGSDLLYLIDGNNSYVNVASAGEHWGSWGTISYLNANGHPDVESTSSDHGFWRLRDAMWLDGHLWIVRQLDKKILKLAASAAFLPILGSSRFKPAGSATIVAEYDLGNYDPIATLGDGSGDVWVLREGSNEIFVYGVAGNLKLSRNAPWTMNGVSGMSWDPRTAVSTLPPGPDTIQIVDRGDPTIFFV